MDAAGIAGRFPSAPGADARTIQRDAELGGGGAGSRVDARTKPPSAPRRGGVPSPQTPDAGGVVRSLASRRPAAGASPGLAEYAGRAAAAGRPFQRQARHSRTA